MVLLLKIVSLTIARGISFLPSSYPKTHFPEPTVVSEVEFIKENKKVRKKERKHALDQESDQENDKEKKKVFLFFLVAFLVESMFSFFLSIFLDRFLGQKRFSCFLLYISTSGKNATIRGFLMVWFVQIQ